MVVVKTYITVNSYSIFSTYISINFTPTTTDDFLIAENTYVLYKNNVLVSNPFGTTVDSPSFTVSELTPNTQYSITITSWNYFWWGQPSEPSKVSKSFDFTTSNYVTGSAPTNLNASNITQNSITVSFTAPTDGNPTQTNYYYSLNGGTTKTDTGSTNTSFTINGLSAFTDFSITMYAYNPNWPGLYSSTSSPLAVKTLAVTGNAPTSVTATATGSSTISVSFSPSSTLGSPSPSTYYYTVNNGSKQNANTTSSPFTISGLNSGTSYTIALYAYNVNWPSADHFSPASNSSTTTTLYVSGSAPSGVSASATSSTEISITYTTGSTGGTPAVSAYYYKIDNASTYSGPISAPPYTFSVSGFSPGSTHSVVIYAYNANWPTQYVGSTPVNVTTYGNGTAPSITSAVATGSNPTSISVSFTGSSGGTPSVSGYYYTLNGGSYVGPISSPFSVSSGLDPKTQYAVIVYAYNANWPTQYVASIPANVTTYGNGDAPSITNITAGFTQLNVTYSPSLNGVPAVSSYFYSLSGGTYNGTVKTAASASPFSIYGLSVGTSYSVIIYAFNTNWPTQYIASAPYVKSTGLTNYSKNATDLITYFALQNGDGEYNNLANTGFLLNGTNPFSNIPMYKEGATRSPIGFQLSGADIGYYYQPNDGLLGYCYDVSTTYSHPSFVYSQITSSTATDIWINTGATSAQGNSYWLYYSFYYSGSSYSGTFHAAIDCSGYLYFNTIGKGLITAKPAINNTGNTGGIPVTLVRGLNYIRVATYTNAAGTNPCAFIAAIYDGASNVVAVSSKHWSWANTTAGYASPSLYYNASGGLAFTFAPTDQFPVALTMNGSVYYTGSAFPIANYITGVPPGTTTFVPASFTSVKTYSFSDISVNFPTGYTLGATSGSFTILALIPANLTLSGTATYTGNPIAFTISGAPAGTTYSTTTFTNLGTYNFSNITVNLPANYTPGTYSGSFIINPISVSLVLSGSLYSYQLPVNTSSYVTTTPSVSGITYSPSQINAAGTYGFAGSGASNIITVNSTGITYGYAVTSTTGTLTVSSGQPVDLSLSGTVYYAASATTPSFAIYSYVTNNKSLAQTSITYNPTNFTTAGPNTLASLSSITFPSGYIAGTYSGTFYIIPYYDYTTTLSTGTTVSIPSWCTKIYYVIQLPGTNYTPASSGNVKQQKGIQLAGFMPGFLFKPSDHTSASTPYHVTKAYGTRLTADGLRNTVDQTIRTGVVSASNGLGGTCYYGSHTNSGSNTMVVYNNSGSSKYSITFIDNNKTVPGTDTYSTKAGSGTTPGSQTGITSPSSISDIASYGAGGTSGSQTGGGAIIRVWFAVQ